MIAHSIFFYTFSIIAVISAIMVTVSKNTVHSVFFLILDFISISCLFIMIGAEFLGMIMLIVYVGAVAVLFLFVVMMLNVAQQKNQWFASQEGSGQIRRRKGWNSITKNTLGMQPSVGKKKKKFISSINIMISLYTFHSNK